MYIRPAASKVTYVGRDGQRHAVPPTLVITAVAHVPDADSCVTPELRRAGNVLVLLGTTGVHFAGSHLDLLTGAHRTASPEAGRAPQFDPESPGRYRGLHQAIRRGLVQSCHDVSEGGLAVAIAEMCIASGLGATIDALPHDEITTALFSESAGRLVVEVAETDADALVGLAGGGRRIGVVTADPILDIAGVATIDGRPAPRRLPRGGLVTLPKALVLAGPGTNRDPDAAFALRLAGADPTVALIDELIEQPERASLRRARGDRRRVQLRRRPRRRADARARHHPFECWRVRRRPSR